MIDKIKLKNFKCFLDLSLNLGALTLLTGFNAAGKSTAIQPLLAVSQTCKEKINRAEILLEGGLVDFGSPTEVLSDQASSNTIEIGFESDCFGISFDLCADKDSGRLLIEELQFSHDEQVETLTEPARIVESLQRISMSESSESGCLRSSINELVYISATRKGPVGLYPAPRGPCLSNAEVGASGEFAAWWFAELSDSEVPDNKCHPSDSAKTLRRQFNAWAATIFPGIEANAIKVLKANCVNLEFKTSATENWRHPGNIGYGLTYVFPIIVAGLLAKPGQIIVIDSPEAHLHPMGQSKIGVFLAAMANAGVQVIIETHSDHILNGARIAVKQSIIKKDDVLIHFFNGGKQVEGGSPPILTCTISSQGTLSDWPEGFFDQAEKDLTELAGLWKN
ncbi:MAG: DUF3696 domain-containing protein [Pseudomonas sp.]|nr:DUF3696 domain-containing protein [Pseudomonas sp.]